jgi:hypothetical protein
MPKLTCTDPLCVARMRLSQRSYTKFAQPLLPARTSSVIITEFTSLCYVTAAALWRAPAQGPGALNHAFPNSGPCHERQAS